MEPLRRARFLAGLSGRRDRRLPDRRRRRGRRSRALDLGHLSATPGKVYRGDTGAIACDHYHRWKDDLDLLAWLGLDAYRLSLSWARLQPMGRGPLNPIGVDFYRQLLTGLRERGIRPFVTLYHWDLPQVLEDEGGWPVRDTASRFADYVGLVSDALGDLVEDWTTLNEPWVASFMGYGNGEHAPGRANTGDAIRAAHHLNLGHGLAAQALRASSRPVRVSVTLLLTDVEAASDRDEDVAAARRLDGAGNRLFLDPLLRGEYPADMLEHYAPTGGFDVVRDEDLAAIQAPLDSLGVNHYHHSVVAADQTTLSWESGSCLCKDQLHPMAGGSPLSRFIACSSGSAVSTPSCRCM